MSQRNYIGSKILFYRLGAMDKDQVSGGHLKSLPATWVVRLKYPKFKLVENPHHKSTLKRAIPSF
ncbi:hypothetical protein FH972_001336 [Carpinus fangiana]|uniref:Uncharacterized protein n=1 Tax=Carpinus fangiana TaxID=176857 RepID=A0A5N6QBE3_9ROSI|nr:hypothetical protein FH972_001336 [Carpinus fangiana]